MFGRLMALMLMLGVCGLVQAAEKVEPVDYKKIKELVPAELAGIKRTECTGEKMKMGELNMAMVTARFAKESDSDNAPRGELVIQDYGAMPQMAEGMAAWSAMEIDRDSDNGYERTCKIAGFPAFETYTKESKHGQIMLLVGKRFLVTLQLDNLPAEQLRKAAEALPLAKLAALK